MAAKDEAKPGDLFAPKSDIPLGMGMLYGLTHAAPVYLVFLREGHFLFIWEHALSHKKSLLRYL